MAYEDKLIEYLSKEIETHTNNLMTFRARINMAIFVGPFVLLGSLLIAAKGVPRNISINAWTVLSGVGITISYLTIGVVCAKIESHIWRQCNTWRHLIARVASQGNVGFTEEDFTFKGSLRKGYAVAYSAMILAFLCAMQIISRIHIIATP